MLIWLVMKWQLQLLWHDWEIESALIVELYYSNDHKITQSITAPGAQSTLVSLKAGKVQCLQKGMMNVHYPFIMYEFTNCFLMLCSVTRRSWIFEKPGEWRSTLVSSPTSFTHASVVKSVSLTQSLTIYHYYLSCVPSDRRFELERKQSKSPLWSQFHGSSSTMLHVRITKDHVPLYRDSSLKISLLNLTVYAY